MTGLEAFAATMPKAELHVHHLGATPIPMLARLAERHPEQGVPPEPDRLATMLASTDLSSFFVAYQRIVNLVRTPDDVYETVQAVGRSFALDHIAYAELTCSPFSSVSRGVPVAAFVEALVAAGADVSARWNVELRWIFDIPRPNHEAASVTLDAALRHGPPELVALGLAGVEVPPSTFAGYFARARAHGLRVVPHTGESTGPESVRATVAELKPDRLGHATSAAQDPQLLELLAAEGIPVEVCLTSNQVTGCVPRGLSHPALAMRRAGVMISINTDDPALFACTLTEEYLKAARLFSLDSDGLVDLALDAVRASFASEDLRTCLLRRIEDHRGRDVDAAATACR